MAVRRVRQHEHRFDSSEVSVDDGHRRFVGDVDLGANPLDDRVRADLLAIVDQQSDTPIGDGDAVRDSGIRQGLFDELDSTRDRQQRGFSGVVDDDDVDLVKKVARALDDVEVTQCDGVERTGNHGERRHAPSVIGRRADVSF